MHFDTRIAVDGNATQEQLTRLANYVARQLDASFPAAGIAADVAAILPTLPRVLERLRPILRTVRCFDAHWFEYYNSLQYTSFLYLLSHELATLNADRALPSRLFCLNRALNAIDLFYAVQLPSVFFISHGIGSVLGNAEYGERLVLFQNVTVGRVGDQRPRIGDNVVLYPGAVVTGKSVIGNHCVVAAGTVVHNTTVPDHTIVRSVDGRLAFSDNCRRLIENYLDSDVQSG